MHARLKALEARASLVVEGHDLAVEHHTPRAQGRSQLAHLGVAGREVAEVAALELDVAVVAERHDPDAVPLDLEPELLLARRQRPAAGHHRLDALRERLVRRIRRRIHAVDHPVVLAGPEQGVAPVEALAVEGGDHLVVAEFLRLVGAAIPDEHRAGAVLALRESRPRTRGTRAGGPRSARRGGSRPGAPARRAEAPTTQASRRARGAGPSGGGERGAPAPRSAASFDFPRERPFGSGVFSKSRFAL